MKIQNVLNQTCLIASDTETGFVFGINGSYLSLWEVDGDKYRELDVRSYKHDLANLTLKELIDFVEKEKKTFLVEGNFI